jgi:uncharacterized protein YndB with AHSA1/START domain
MRRPSSGAFLFLALIALDGCGASVKQLNHLAASGSIHEEAPVTAHLQIEIAAPTARVWALLIDASSWPAWQKPIESVTAPGPLAAGTTFTWRTGGTSIRSQVQLFEPERRLGWTGKAMTAHAVHIWELKPEAPNRTLVTMKESMDGPFMAKLFPSQKLAAADNEWLLALKRAAEQNP